MMMSSCVESTKLYLLPINLKKKKGLPNSLCLVYMEANYTVGNVFKSCSDFLVF